jgi:hypothetical protein
MISKKKNYLIFLFLILIISYLVFNTGIFADDYSQSRSWFGRSFKEYINLSFDNIGAKMLSRIPEYLIFNSIFFFTNITSHIFFDIYKVIVIISSIYLLYYFAKKIFLGDENKAFLFSLILVFYPSHDSIHYYYTLLPYSLFMPALFFYSLLLITQNRFFYFSRILFFICSFFSYSSPPYIFSSIFFFIFKKKYNDAIFAFFCLFSYLIYYLYLTNLDPTSSRLSNIELNINQFLKEFILQIISSFDANIGFSFFYKIFISFNEISYLSVIILIIIFFLFQKVKFHKTKIDKGIVFFFLLIYISSLVMYALTFQYPQSSFNFANRVTIYFAPLIAYIVASYSKGFKDKIIIFLIVVIPTFSLSDHAKKWNNQKKIIENNIKIKMNNKNIKNHQIFINYYMYSKIGNINHLEYLISPWILKSIFFHNKVYSIHSRTFVDKNFFFDEKFNFKVKLDKNIFFYDLLENKITPISNADLKKLIEKTEIEIRHPVQIFFKKYQDNFISYLPKYKYLFIK